jgi:hypothetical protein
MVLAAEMSSGRIVAETVSCRTSALVRTSSVPSMIRFPFGQDPGHHRRPPSGRWPRPGYALPEPEFAKVDCVLKGRGVLKSFPGGQEATDLSFHAEQARSRRASALEVRFVAEVFEVLAESLIAIWTVTMSPIRLALWSMKKARAPLRQSELAEAGVDFRLGRSIMPRSGLALLRRHRVRREGAQAADLWRPP